MASEDAPPPVVKKENETLTPEEIAAAPILENYEDYKLMYESSGAGTTVYLCKEKRTGTIRVVKKYRDDLLSIPQQKMVDRELRVSQLLLHENIVTVVDRFHGKGRAYLVQEYCSQGDLFKVIHRLPNAKAPENYVAQIMLQLTIALAYCHDLGVIHRDIKPENVVMTWDGVVKLCDFGLAIYLPEERPVSRAGTLVRPEEFMAPEILNIVERDRKHIFEENPYHPGFYDEKVDSWALGCMAYELLVGRSPFAARNDDKIEDKIHTGSYVVPASAPITDHARTFLNACLRQNPAVRLSARQLLGHPWCLGSLNALAGCSCLMGCQKIGEEGHRCGGPVEDLAACYAELAPEPLSEEDVQERFSDSAPDTPAEARGGDPTGLAAASAVVAAAAGGGGTPAKLKTGAAGDADAGAKGKPPPASKGAGAGGTPTKGVAGLSIKGGTEAARAALKGASGTGSTSGQGLSSKGGGASGALRPSSSANDVPAR